MTPIDIINKKRDGAEHTDAEIQFLIDSYTRGDIPDYQMTIWLMAVMWLGLSDKETFALTGAMASSGRQLDLANLPGVPVDKHSTGGVGDKTSLVVVPILASAGIPVVKMSGRALGHTGGTLDKLESIPGVGVNFDVEQILRQVRTVGAVLCAQTADLVPADKKMYALRDATSTVGSLPLIAASIMSKKLAGGASGIVLDVKVGRGAFMKTLDQGHALADLMMKIGASHGRKVAAVLTNMDYPLGRAVGNTLEVAEAEALLLHPERADARLRELVLRLSALGLTLGAKTETPVRGYALAEHCLESGAAYRKWQEILDAQGRIAGAAGATARFQRVVHAPRAGYVTDINALAVGKLSMCLGAGRSSTEDEIDFAAGIMISKSVGDPVAVDEPLATFFANSEEKLARASGSDWFEIGDHLVDPLPLIYETITSC